MNLEAAKKEGKVVIYGTIVPQVMTLIEKGFEGKYGLKVEYWRADATKVIDRVLTEWRAGKPGFDIVIGARGALLLGKEENVYAKFVPTNTASFPAKFKDPDGKLTAWRVTPVGVLYNTELVKAADVPKISTICSMQSGKGRSACPILRATPARPSFSGIRTR